MRRYSFLLCPLLLSAALNSQTASPAKQDTMKTTSPMDSNAKMTKKKHKSKKSTKSDDSMKNDTTKDTK